MSRWRNGLVFLQQWLCYLQGPWFESHLRPVEFSPAKKVSPLTNWTQTTKSVPCGTIRKPCFLYYNAVPQWTKVEKNRFGYMYHEPCVASIPSKDVKSSVTIRNTVTVILSHLWHIGFKYIMYVCRCCSSQ